jgi:hypothetical protein
VCLDEGLLLNGGSDQAQAPRHMHAFDELCPAMPATVIGERIGWQRSITVLREKVAELRPSYLPKDPVSRTAYEPGERVQDDFWFPPAEIPVGHGRARRALMCRRRW